MTKNILLSRIVRISAFAALCASAATADHRLVMMAQAAPPQQGQFAQPAPLPAQIAPQAPAQAPPPAETRADGWTAVEEPAGAGVESEVSVARRRSESELRRGTELSVQALAAAPFLFYDRDAKGYLRPGNAKIEAAKEKAAYQLFDKVMVKPAAKAALEYKIGDTVDILTHDGLIKFKGGSAQLITRRGRGVVEEFVGKRMAMKIIEMWGIIRGGESILPTTKFTPVYCDNLAAPETEIKGTVVFKLSETVTPYLHQYFIIDKGSDDGVKLGDFFLVKERVRAKDPSAELLEAQVVSVTSASATLVVQKLLTNRLKAGDHAILNRRPVPREQAGAGE